MVEKKILYSHKKYKKIRKNMIKGMKILKFCSLKLKLFINSRTHIYKKYFKKTNIVFKQTSEHEL